MKIPSPHTDRHIRLPHRLSVYVPTLTQTGDRIRDRGGLLETVQTRLTTLCGGTTSTETTGTYVTEQGQIVTESVTIVAASCQELSPVWADFWDLAQTVLCDGEQDSLAVSVDAELYLLYNEHREKTGTPFGGSLYTDRKFWD